MMRALYAALLNACLGFTSGSAEAGCGPYRVGFYSFGSFHYLDGSGQPTGIDPDLISALAARSGCVLQGQLESRVRIWTLLERGQLDLTVSGIPTESRLRMAEFWPYMRAHNQALMSKALAQRLDSPEAFLAEPELRVGVVRGFRHGPKLDEWLSRLRQQRRVDELGDYGKLLQVLRAGRVSLVLVHPFNLRPEDQAWLSDFALRDWAPGDEVTVNLVVSRSNVRPEDRALLQRSLQSLLADGEVDRILRNHLGESLARSTRLPR